MFGNGDWVYKVCPNPAKVRFIGDENAYRRGYDDCYTYCRECDEKANCSKTPIYKFTRGQIYDAFFLEYWCGKRESLHVIDNQGELTDFNDINDFEIVSDPDHLLNLHEAIVLCLSNAYDEIFELKCGKTYTAIGRDKGRMFLIKDETGDCYFYPAYHFKIIEDKYEILSHKTLYFDFWDAFEEGYDESEPDHVKAHQFSSNNRPSLQTDTQCGCFYCLSIFEPKEITDWIVDHNPYDNGGTAKCPYCDIDSVIGSQSGYPITKEFLGKMHDYWFGDSE